jgi:NADH-quinone oxidoreductase subunit H
MALLKELFYDSGKPLTEFYTWMHGIWAGWGMPGFLLDFIFQLAIVAAVTVILVLNALWIIYYDRKISALMQIRKGPNRVGPLGLFQTLADTVKLLIKEDINPKKVDILSFWLAPLIIFIPTFAVFLVLPFGSGLIPADLNIGILYVMAITGLTVIGILAAGWGSNNKYSLIGGMRSAAQIVSYEIPMVIVILTVVLMSGTMKMSGIVAAQAKQWFILPQCVGFIVFLIVGNAEVNRAPFDLPEAESELVAGFNTEYSAMKFAFFYLAEYTNLFLTAAIATTLFLGGWQGPWPVPPIVWFFLKTYFVITILCWIRWTFPRIRVDQLMEFSWKYMLPIALVNLVVTAIIIKL